MTGFTDKGIVVTGAARGMGLAIAERFHAEGATEDAAARRFAAAAPPTGRTSATDARPGARRRGTNHL